MFCISSFPCYWKLTMDPTEIRSNCIFSFTFYFPRYLAKYFRKNCGIHPQQEIREENPRCAISCSFGKLIDNIFIRGKNRNPVLGVYDKVCNALIEGFPAKTQNIVLQFKNIRIY